MLRNRRVINHLLAAPILNEVLSLNAQECIGGSLRSRRCLLNEVLSLNAQEYSSLMLDADGRIVLNEVLSLNAQELEDASR